MSGFVSDAVLTDGVLGRRALAWLVDAILMGVILGLLHVALVYIVAFVASPGQATPGQAYMGLRVVRDEDLGRPEPAQACVYAILYAATMWVGGLLLFAAFFTRRARCLHDIFSGLLVARADAVAPASTKIWTMAGGPFRS